MPIQAFLAKNKSIFGTSDGLPGAYHRAMLFSMIKPGKQAGIVTPHGSLLSGRVVMSFPEHAVLNLGGRHGTPAVVTASNCVYVAGAKL